MAENEADTETENRDDDIVTDAETVSSEALLKGARELWIDHHGERYRLRLTRKGKLILQK
jgi:hemin uptake protein HemP